MKKTQIVDIIANATIILFALAILFVAAMGIYLENQSISECRNELLFFFNNLMASIDKTINIWW